MPTSIRQIAGICSVSEATVSKALTGRPGVSQETRKRIRDVAHRMNYVRNALVHGMQRGETMSIGIGCNGLTSAFAAGLLAAILRILHEHDRQALTFDWDQELGEGKQALRSLAERRVDGLILFPPAHLPPSQYLAALHRLPCPVVVVDQHYTELPFDFVGSDDADGMRQIVAHLHDELGIDRIACLHFPGVSTGRDRRSALLEELVRRGCKLPPQWDVEVSLDPDETYATCCNLLEDRLAAPQAMVCFNDETAAMALAAAQTLGLKVPEDVAVVGYGDLPIARLFRPELTTVDQHLDRIAREAVELLLARVADHRSPDPSAPSDQDADLPVVNDAPAASYVRVPVTLVRRSSTLADTNLVASEKGGAGVPPVI